MPALANASSPHATAIICCHSNTRLKAFLEAVMAVSNSGIWQFKISIYGFPFPSFFAVCAALRTSFNISPKLNACNNGVEYLRIVSVSSPFDFLYFSFARLFAPFTDHLIRRFFIRNVIRLQFWFSCTPRFLYTIPGTGWGIAIPLSL